jgi:hypothetical protein
MKGIFYEKGKWVRSKTKNPAGAGFLSEMVELLLV